MRRRQFLGALAGAGALPLLAPLPAGASARRDAVPAYVGSFSSANPAGRGFEVTNLDTATGALAPGRVVEGVPDASFLACSPDGKILYTTNEQPEGRVTALSLEDSAAPRVLNTARTGGAAPTHLSVHPAGFLLTANYGDGTVSVHRLEADGRIGTATDLVRHDGSEPHAHQVFTDPNGERVVAVDLGADAVYVYGLDVQRGKLLRQQKLSVPTGTGPRHLAWHPDGRRAYLVAELASTVTVLGWDGAAFTAGQVLSTRDEGATGQNFPAEIAVTSDGRFVYASNRGDDTIAVFVVHADGLARLGSTPTGGQWPRHFAFAPDESALHVANQNSGTITRLPRDHATGALAPAAGSAPFTAAAVLAFGAK